MRRVLALAALLAGALAVALPASADAPSVQVQHLDLGGTNSWLCGFEIATVGGVDVTTTTFVDSSGAPVRISQRSRATGTYHGPTGRLAWYDQVMNSQLDLASGVQTVTGQSTRVAAPEAGVILHAAGRVGMLTGSFPPTILFDRGLGMLLTVDDWQVVCDYLAGP